MLILQKFLRQSGRTTRIINNMKDIPNAIFVTMTVDHALRISKQFNIKTCSLSQFSNMKGADLRVFCDHTVQEYINDNLRKIS